ALRFRIGRGDWLLACESVSFSAGQIGADLLPTHAAVSGLKHVLRAEVQSAGVLWGEKQRRSPSEPEFLLVDVKTPNIHRQRRNVLSLSRGLVEAVETAIGVSGVHGVGISGVGCDVSAFTTGHGVPVTIGDRTIIAAAGNR